MKRECSVNFLGFENAFNFIVEGRSLDELRRSKGMQNERRREDKGNESVFTLSRMDPRALPRCCLK